MKKLLAILVALCAVPTLATDYQPYNKSDPWSCTLAAQGATTTECEAAPGAGLRRYVTSVLVVTTTGTAGTWQLKYGTGTDCGTGTTALSPVAYTAPISTALPQNIVFNTPVIPPAAKAICVLGSSNTNTIAIVVTGFTAP